jgi:hypothetical protein
MKMMRESKLMLSVLALVLGAFIISACSDDDKKAKLTVGFTYEADGKTISFTSTATGADEYEWSFGDGNTSSEQNPTHTYTENGTYTVSLTVKQGSSTLTETDEVVVSKNAAVTIDGSFSDWSSIADAAVSTKDESSLSKLKVDFDANYVYVYVEGTSDMKGYFNIYLDVDNNPSTGATEGFEYLYYNFGADYLLDGYIGENKDGELYKDNPDNEGWCWTIDCDSDEVVPVVGNGSGLVISSDLVDIGGGKKAIEFGILRAAIPGLQLEFRFAVTDVDAGGTWSAIGSVPSSGLGEDSEMLLVSLK